MIRGLISMIVDAAVGAAFLAAVVLEWVAVAHDLGTRVAVLP